MDLTDLALDYSDFKTNINIAVFLILKTSNATVKHGQVTGYCNIGTFTLVLVSSTL